MTFYQSVGMNVVTSLPHLSTEMEMMLINLGVDKQRARSVMENQLSSALRRIVALTQKTDHIPPITTNEANPFPYQVFNLRKLCSEMEDYYSCGAISDGDRGRGMGCGA